MRTTLTIDDALFERLKRRAFESGKSLKLVVNEALAAGLDAPPVRRVRYRPRIASLGEPLLDLQHATRIAGALEDEELARKLALRK
jgi:predicted HAD superfamily phosphohydrolase